MIPATHCTPSASDASQGLVGEPRHVVNSWSASVSVGGLSPTAIRTVWDAWRFGSTQACLRNACSPCYASANARGVVN
jgi:hypothetical protein